MYVAPTPTTAYVPIYDFAQIANHDLAGVSLLMSIIHVAGNTFVEGAYTPSIL
jgi:hypothetical protein